MYRNALRILALVLVSLSLGITSFYQQMFILVNGTQVGVLLTERWLAPAAAAILLVAAGRHTVSPMRPSCFRLIVGLATVLYILSSRGMVVNVVKAEIDERWFGFPVRTYTLDSLDDHPFCYKTDLMTLRVKSQGTKPFAYFRGIWPAYLDSASIDRELAFLGKCEQ